MSDLRDSGSMSRTPILFDAVSPKMHDKSDTDECELIISKSKRSCGRGYLYVESGIHKVYGVYGAAAWENK